MAHNEVWKAFGQILPIFKEKATMWFPNGKNSIRVRIGEVPAHQDLIFTFNNSKEWRFETVDAFIKIKR